MLKLARLYGGGSACVRNGTMGALDMSIRAQVGAAHTKAIELSATDEAKTGLRCTEAMGFYSI